MPGLIGYMVKSAASLAIALFLTAAGMPIFAAEVPEPDGMWTGPMRGDTPATLEGAIVLDLPALEALIAEKPILLDVGPLDKKPEDFPADRLWLPTHRTISGAVWFPGGGAAVFDQAKEEAFFRRLEELTQGDQARAIVTFCHPQCWASWNAGKRLVMKGYTGVHWFPGGIDKWQETHETVAVEPDAVWALATAK